MIEDYEVLMKEQIAKTLKSINEIAGENMILGSTDNKSFFASMQEDIIREYAGMLEKKEQELIQGLENALIEFGAKISATRSLLRMLGQEEEKRAGIKREIHKETILNVQK